MGSVLVLGALLAVSGGCNARDPMLETPPLPVGPSGLPGAAVTLHGFSLNPVAVNGSGTSIGTAALTGPAPPGGVTINLSAADPSVSVPATVTVPEGSWNAQFNVSTQVVAADTQVAIVASLGGGSVSAVLAVWTALPMFFSWTSDVGESIGQGGYGRFTPPSTRFNASCDGSDIYIFATGSNWASLAFGAPRGTPLRVGSYEGATHLQARNATDPTATYPGINVSVGSRACGTPLYGRFVVHEAEFTAQGDVIRFWATFEQRCHQPTGPALRGEVRLTNVPLHTFTTGCTL